MEAALKQQILKNYLTQQVHATNDMNASNFDANSIVSDAESSVYSNLNPIKMNTVNIPCPEELEEFKDYVKKWTTIDMDITKLQAALRERNSVKKQITQKIIGFMSKYNIEDLNTKDGKLSYRVTQVKVQPKKAEIRTKLLEHFSPETTAQELCDKVLESAETVEKHKLQRKKQTVPKTK